MFRETAAQKAYQELISDARVSAALRAFLKSNDKTVLDHIGNGIPLDILINKFRSRNQAVRQSAFEQLGFNPEETAFGLGAITDTEEDEPYYKKAEAFRNQLLEIKLSTDIPTETIETIAYLLAATHEEHEIDAVKTQIARLTTPIASTTNTNSTPSVKDISAILRGLKLNPDKKDTENVTLAQTIFAYNQSNLHNKLAPDSPIKRALENKSTREKFIDAIRLNTTGILNNKYSTEQQILDALNSVEDNLTSFDRLASRLAEFGIDDLNTTKAVFAKQQLAFLIRKNELGQIKNSRIKAAIEQTYKTGNEEAKQLILEAMAKIAGPGQDDAYFFNLANNLDTSTLDKTKKSWENFGIVADDIEASIHYLQKPFEAFRNQLPKGSPIAVFFEKQHDAIFSKMTSEASFEALKKAVTKLNDPKLSLREIVVEIEVFHIVSGNDRAKELAVEIYSQNQIKNAANISLNTNPTLKSIVSKNLNSNIATKIKKDAERAFKEASTVREDLESYYPRTGEDGERLTFVEEAAPYASRVEKSSDDAALPPLTRVSKLEPFSSDYLEEQIEQLQKQVTPKNVDVTSKDIKKTLKKLGLETEKLPDRLFAERVYNELLTLDLGQSSVGGAIHNWLNKKAILESLALSPLSSSVIQVKLRNLIVDPTYSVSKIDQELRIFGLDERYKVLSNKTLAPKIFAERQANRLIESSRATVDVLGKIITQAGEPDLVKAIIYNSLTTPAEITEILSLNADANLEKVTAKLQKLNLGDKAKLVYNDYQARYKFTLNYAVADTEYKKRHAELRGFFSEGNLAKLDLPPKPSDVAKSLEYFTNPTDPMDFKTFMRAMKLAGLLPQNSLTQDAKKKEPSAIILTVDEETAARRLFAEHQMNLIEINLKNLKLNPSAHTRTHFDLPENDSRIDALTSLFNHESVRTKFISAISENQFNTTNEIREALEKLVDPASSIEDIKGLCTNLNVPAANVYAAELYTSNQYEKIRTHLPPSELKTLIDTNKTIIKDALKTETVASINESVTSILSNDADKVSAALTNIGIPTPIERVKEIQADNILSEFTHALGIANKDVSCEFADNLKTKSATEIKELTQKLQTDRDNVEREFGVDEESSKTLFAKIQLKRLIDNADPIVKPMLEDKAATASILEKLHGKSRTDCDALLEKLASPSTRHTSRAVQDLGLATSNVEPLLARAKYQQIMQGNCPKDSPLKSLLAPDTVLYKYFEHEETKITQDFIGKTDDQINEYILTLKTNINLNESTSAYETLLIKENKKNYENVLTRLIHFERVTDRLLESSNRSRNDNFVNTYRDAYIKEIDKRELQLVQFIAIAKKEKIDPALIGTAETLLAKLKKAETLLADRIPNQVAHYAHQSTVIEAPDPRAPDAQAKVQELSIQAAQAFMNEAPDPANMTSLLLGNTGSTDRFDGSTAWRNCYWSSNQDQTRTVMIQRTENGKNVANLQFRGHNFSNKTGKLLAFFHIKPYLPPDDLLALMQDITKTALANCSYLKDDGTVVDGYKGPFVVTGPCESRDHALAMMLYCRIVLGINARCQQYDIEITDKQKEAYIEKLQSRPELFYKERYNDGTLKVEGKNLAPTTTAVSKLIQEKDTALATSEEKLTTKADALRPRRTR